MKKLLTYFIIITLGLTPLALYASTTPWVLMKEKKGVKAYKRHQPSKLLYAFKGEGIINAPIDKVLTILLDDKRATEWVPRLASCKIIDNKNWPINFKQYSIFNAPWPIKDRFFISEVRVTATDDNRGVNISFSNITDLKKLETTLPALKKFIHGRIDGSHYKLVAIDQNRTQFTAASIVQPRGKIPAWLINWAGASMPFDTFKQLNRQLSKGNIKVPPEVTQLLNKSTNPASNDKIN